MELVFNQAEKMWVAEFEASADFNLHIERSSGGNILLYQRTQGGGWDIVDDFSAVRWQGVIDYDCTALIYPKYLKIVSESRPDYAAVISTGEVAEVKSQSKEIEVTSNGTTEVTPDAGFAYLNSVKVKTNVPQSGEGGGSSDGRYGMLFFDISNVPENMILQILQLSFLENNGEQISPATLTAYNSQGYEENLYGIKKVAVVYGYASNKMQMTKEVIMGLFGQLNAPEITEEEFYTL